ncbi:MAG: BolA family protein [Mariprofundus sp.]|nr:BolA family protein [Mariprofundus sp.]
MSNTSDTIRDLLEKEFHPQCLQIEDESWKHSGHAGVREHGGGHYIVHIKSEHFSRLSRSQCHRMIYRALAPLFPSAIHALSIHIDSSDG